MIKLYTLWNLNQETMNFLQYLTHISNYKLQEPEHRVVRWFYSSAKSINMSLVTRTIIFFIVYVMVFVSAIMDIATATGNMQIIKFGHSS